MVSIETFDSEPAEMVQEQVRHDLQSSLDDVARCGFLVKCMGCGKERVQ